MNHAKTVRQLRMVFFVFRWRKCIEVNRFFRWGRTRDYIQLDPNHRKLGKKSTYPGSIKIFERRFFEDILQVVYDFCGDICPLINQMQELHILQTQQLIDLLTQQTAIVTKLFSEKNFGEEYEKQKLFLKAIQSEIDLRKSTETTDITTPPDFTN